MATILIAWELGEAFGHLARCTRLALELRQRGHRIVLLLKDLRLPPAQWSALNGITILPTPLTPQLGARAAPPVNYADLLRCCGFASPDELSARLRAWQGVFELVRPAVLIADYAPTALLGAHYARVPAMTIGNGFVIPPPVTPWPSIRPWLPVAAADLLLAEQTLDRVITAASQQLGHRHPPRLRELFGAHDMLDTFPELDHYGPRAAAQYLPPLVALPQTTAVHWPPSALPRIVAYLRPGMPGFGHIMAALSASAAEVLCVVPGITAQQARHFASPTLRIARQPLDLSLLLPDADLAISYGSSGFVSQALLAATPLLLAPRHVEQMMFSQRVVALGAGRLWDARSATDAQQLLHSMLADGACSQAAQAFAARYRHLDPVHALALTGERITQQFGLSPG